MNKKTVHKQSSLYQCPETIRYVVEQTFVRIIETERGHDCKLTYPDAAIWDFLCRGYTRQRIEQLLVHICFISNQHAAYLVDDCCARLLSDGFLQEANNHG